MSTTPPATTPTTTQTTTPGFASTLGGGFLLPAPLPPVTPYFLRQEDFLTLCDGEMSEVRSIRDICIGAFIAGAIAIASLDWDVTLKQGRHPILSTVTILTITGAALIIAFVCHLIHRHTRKRSAYSRQVKTVKEYFKIEETDHWLIVWIRRTFTSAKS